MSNPVLRTALFLIAAAGVAVAVGGLLRLSLEAMAAGAALWLLGGYLWERLGSTYRP